MWQEIIVGLCIIAALAFLLRHYLPTGKKKAASGCGGCNGCDTKKGCH